MRVIEIKNLKSEKEVNHIMAEGEKKVEKAKVEKPAEPEMVSLKEVAKRAGVEPREARSILRKISTRVEGEKRSRWQWAPAEVNGVVAKIKAAVADRAKVKAEKAAAAAEEEEE